MFLNKIKPFLVISICVLVLSLTNINVQSQEVKLISGIAKVVDGDTIKIENKKLDFLVLMHLKKNKNVESLG